MSDMQRSGFRLADGLGGVLKMQKAPMFLGTTVRSKLHFHMLLSD